MIGTPVIGRNYSCQEAAGSGAGSGAGSWRW